MKILILIADSNGGYPVPASKGGATSTLIESLVRCNSMQKLVDFTVLSFYDIKAEELSHKYSNVNFMWVKVPYLITILDKLTFSVVRNLFPRKKSISFRSIFSLFFYINRSSAILKSSHYDKVLIENNIPLVWSIRLSNYNGDFYYHLENVPRINARSKAVFKQCTRFVCCSKFVGNEIQKEDNPIGPIDSSKISVVYNCIDTNLFRHRDVSRKKYIERFGFEENDRIIVYVGRLSKEKGIDQLLNSIEFINTPNIKILIVGSLIYNLNVKDAYLKEIQELASRYKDIVFFTGYIDQRTLPDIYSIAEIAILPSMWDEPAGLTMIESLACGTPVITTQSGGIPEYVKGGAVVLDRNQNLPSEIAKHVDLLLSDKSIYLEYQQKGMERVLKNFNANDYLVNFLEALR